jgi:hypothetical protein
MDPITLALIGGGLMAGGGIANVIGAYGQKDEALKQQQRQNTFAAQQRGAFDTGWGDLMSQAKGLATYQGDLTKYNQAEDLAKQNQLQASGASRVAGEQIARDQASRATADTMAMARRAGGSSSDLMTAALMGQQQENAAQSDISARSQQQLYTQQQQAKQDYLNQIGVSAAAAAQQHGLEYSSLAGKQQAVLGMSQQQLQGKLSLEDALFQQQQAKAGELANANAAIYSGWGNIGTQIGSGLMSAGFEGMKMANLGKANTPTVFANPSTSSTYWSSGTPTPTQIAAETYQKPPY